MPDIKLGSLFDGIGVFPFAASRCGIRPVWASEIEKAPISITKRHFPEMEHLGDITKIDSGKIEPVHVLIFGSPLSKPFTDRQPLRPCRGKIKPVLSGFPYCTWPRPRSISVIPMCGEVPARPLPLTAPASSAGSILQAVSTTCPVPRHRALQPVCHHPVLRGKAVGHYLFHRNL